MQAKPSSPLLLRNERGQCVWQRTGRKQKIRDENECLPTPRQISMQAKSGSLLTDKQKGQESAGSHWPPWKREHFLPTPCTPSMQEKPRSLGASCLTVLIMRTYQ